MVKRMKYIPVVQSCQEIEDGRYLCKNEDISHYTRELCIEQLMLLKNNYNACKQQEVTIEKVKIQSITKNQWMLYSEEDVIITERCQDEFRKHSLQGTYILTRNRHCEIQLGDTLITPVTNASNIVLNLPLIQLPALNVGKHQENRDTNWKTINLKNVDLRDVSEVMNNLKNFQRPTELPLENSSLGEGGVKVANPTSNLCQQQ
ncbi:unnamed protein product [Diatraea saccharalis]|uniref:Uncharacterized protein n=1 Tax=Diatraea saccharalis TaxID=40085 RepID=A0A9N9WKD6_9NEOP|nr:unnamed protein product [Diatraea saccharalis]